MPIFHQHFEKSKFKIASLTEQIMKWLKYLAANKFLKNFFENCNLYRGTRESVMYSGGFGNGSVNRACGCRGYKKTYTF